MIQLQLALELDESKEGIENYISMLDLARFAKIQWNHLFLFYLFIQMRLGRYNDPPQPTTLSEMKKKMRRSYGNLPKNP